MIILIHNIIADDNECIPYEAFRHTHISKQNVAQANTCSLFADQPPHTSSRSILLPLRCTGSLKLISRPKVQCSSVNHSRSFFKFLSAGNETATTYPWYCVPLFWKVGHCKEKQKCNASAQHSEQRVILENICCAYKKLPQLVCNREHEKRKIIFAKKFLIND